MVRIGEVWDSTMDAARGRARLLAPIVLGAFFAPAVVQNAIGAFGGSGPAATGGSALIVLATALLTLWGQLAVIAVVTDPATTRADAVSHATRRFGPALANAAALAAVAILALVPLFVAFSAAGIPFAALAGPQGRVQIMLQGAPGGALTFAAFYSLAFVIFAFWLSARVMLAYAVALNERRGLGAIARSFGLTRGLTARLMGVLLLYGIVLLIALTAAQAIVFVPARIALAAPAALFVAGVGSALVSSILVALLCIFTGRLYVAAAEHADRGY